MKTRFMQNALCSVGIVLLCGLITTGNIRAGAEAVLVRNGAPKAIIVLGKRPTRSAQLAAKELQEHAKKITAPYKYPRSIEYIQELPKTVSGKIKRNVLRQREQEKHQK